MKPAGNRGLIGKLDAETKIGVLEIPDEQRERPQRGEVIACGKACIEGFKPGEIVYFPKWSGFDVPDSDNEVILFEDEVWGSDE